MTTQLQQAMPVPGAARRSGHPGIALFIIAACQLMIVLDSTIVNVALPNIQRSLGFSTTDLSWVLSAYTLTFGGMLLLGGRAGDILGRRRVFTTGIVVFTLASLLGGLAQEPWQLLAARALQGVGGAIASPTSLALITTNFAEGPERNRAMGVFAGVSGAGAAVGLLAGGMLTEWLDWRWVLFVNLPIGLVVAVLAPVYINESRRHPGHFDVAGAATSTLGMASLVYGFIRASEDGWSDPLTVTAFVAAAVLLAAFVLVESRAAQPIIPLRMFGDRNRVGSYVIILCLAGAMYGMFFFIVQFFQIVLGYSPIRSGLASLTFTGGLVIAVGITQRLLPVLGPKPFVVIGSALSVVGLGWLTFIGPGTTFVGGVVGPLFVFGAGVGLNFVTLTLTSVSGVAQHEAGAASGVLNASQQVGGSLGLSIMVTVFGTASRNEAEQQLPSFLARAGAAEKAELSRTGQLPGHWGHQVLAEGISSAFVTSAAMAAVALLVALVLIRVRKSDLENLTGKAAAAGPGL
ncbi:MFS transporter [Actinacidiphila glaucinigra]|uniref:Drug resistance transporter, EmrB/QacA subfamily n=1 Tax=Actinacidiphila glaucinigra TaxID=235986 RepID=A0A239GEX5_9ACTN|nr:MFS transporter [Actinacidiphila glaucinigra]SNS67282.1 drug resistance transporter, EmrB/QacA subfamily [Actinacidiphila glaucinigra]